MANVDHPHGLRPLMRTLAGGFPVVRKFTKDSGEQTAIFQWDAVHRQADGNIAAAGATPGTTLYQGVSLNHGAATTETSHIVVISPDAVYEAQDNDDTDGFAAADMGLNVNIELNAGSATTLISGHELDESTANISADRDLKMIDLHRVPDNAFGEFSRIEVVFNRHMMMGFQAGI